MYPKGRTYLGNRQQRKTSHDSGRSGRDSKEASAQQECTDLALYQTVRF